MKKKLIAIGKGLIAIGLLWPVPISLIVAAIYWISELSGIPIYAYPPLNFLTFIPDWTHVLDVSDDAVLYWWPFLIVMALGVVMCIFVKHKQINEVENTAECLSPTMLRIAFYALAIVVGFNLLMLLVVGIYYYFIYIEVTAVATIFLLIFGWLIWFGRSYYRDAKSKNKNN